MWVSEDGRLMTVAIPTEHVWALPGVSEFAPDVASFADWDYGREGGPIEAIIAEAERGYIGASPAEEAHFHAEAIPEEFITRFPWAEISDLASAESALEDVPLRWRLDMQAVVETLIYDVQDGIGPPDLPSPSS